MPDAQVRINTPLVDSEKELAGVYRIRHQVQLFMFRHAADEPPKGSLAGNLGILVSGGILHAFVKGHCHIRAQIGLDAHALLGAHKNPVPVDVGGEGHPVLGYLAQAGKRKDLEPAAVGEDGSVPVHEFVEAAHFPHHAVPGP
ncbi:hypothetical protein SDC9_121299 [bioreactor metagenome]|uniref:Uncharacterized protein n=1 Tax=bioreactor metagenome TaxID=1076179 RepID=A0A645CBP9_9ZZZZ